ncbi:hypothetical protein DV515_00011621 [Chloebia gouldiae]|uniref:Uncharacterized protein n=1 Tax=Chloebia gouldiae TaxID=44316 RepID=A0A3L8S5S2_CHLGU|nr:hypothetical protein DV515_00011621 [Chloebia gouldiae]
MSLDNERGKGIQTKLENERLWSFKRAMKLLQKYWNVYGGPALLWAVQLSIMESVTISYQKPAYINYRPMKCMTEEIHDDDGVETTGGSFERLTEKGRKTGYEIILTDANLIPWVKLWPKLLSLLLQSHRHYNLVQVLAPADSPGAQHLWQNHARQVQLDPAGSGLSLGFVQLPPADAMGSPCREHQPRASSFSRSEAVPQTTLAPVLQICELESKPKQYQLSCQRETFSGRCDEKLTPPQHEEGWENTRLVAEQGLLKSYLIHCRRGAKKPEVAWYETEQKQSNSPLLLVKITCKRECRGKSIISRAGAVAGLHLLLVGAPCTAQPRSPRRVVPALGALSKNHGRKENSVLPAPELALGFSLVCVITGEAVECSRPPAWGVCVRLQPCTDQVSYNTMVEAQTPQPVENYISEGEFEDDLSSSTPSTTELEVRGSSQETDEDYFETVSHQSGSLSDVKTEPYESASDTESLSSDITGNACLDSNCLFTEKKPLCCNLPKEKAESFHELKSSRQPEFTQHVQLELSSKIKEAPSKTKFCIQFAELEGEELGDEELTLSSDISITESQGYEESILSQAKRKPGTALQIQHKHLKENGLESELSDMEIVAGERWADDSSDLGFGWKVLETATQPNGSDRGAEHGESGQQNASCKTGALRRHSELGTNEHPVHKGKDEESVFAVERTPRSDYIRQGRDLMATPELKPSPVIVSVEERGLQSKTLNDNLPTEVVAETLGNGVGKDLLSPPHTVSKAHGEPEGVLSESWNCEELILATHPIPGSAEVLSGRDAAEVKPEISEEKRGKTESVSSLGFTCSNSAVASTKLEFRNVAVPLGSDTLTAEIQTDPCEKSLIKSPSGGGVRLSEDEPCRAGALVTGAVTLGTSSSVSSVCQGHGAGVSLERPSPVKSQGRIGVMAFEEGPSRTKRGFEFRTEQLGKSGFRNPGRSDDQMSKEEEFKAHRSREEGLNITRAVTVEMSSSVSSLWQGDGAGVSLQGPSMVSGQAVGRQGKKICNGSKEETGICEEPSPREGKEGSAAGDTSSPNKDSALSLDVSDVFDESLNRETHSTFMLGLDSVSTCSTNSEELDENSSHILGSNSSLHKAVPKPTKNENSGKASRFLVFPKMTSFKKTKPASWENQGSSSIFGSKAKMEELDVGKDDEDTASLLSFKSCSSGLVFHRKESYTSEYSDDDDLFYERPAGFFNRLSLRKASGSGRILMEDVDRQVSGSSENNDSETVEHSGIRKSFPENEHKRNKTPEGKKFRTRLALAHKSLSSLFESKCPEKENTEQSSKVSVKNEKEKAKLRHSTWKAFLKSKEADGLKRPVLVSLSSTQESLNATGGHMLTAEERQHSSTFFKTETDNGSLTNSNYFDSCVEPVDVSLPARMWRRRIQSHDLGIRYSQSSDCDEQQEVLSNSLNTSLEEYWKSPFSPTDLHLAFSQSSPSCPQLSSSDGKDMPCRPMSPKPQSSRSTSQHRNFRYPGRVCAASMISLGSSSAVESSLEAPERPKTLKPRGSLLPSLDDFQRDDSGISSQSQISLNTASSISDMLRDELQPGISIAVSELSVLVLCQTALDQPTLDTLAATQCVKQESKQPCQTAPGKRPNKKWVPHRKRRPPRVPPCPVSTLESRARRLSFLAPDEKAKEIPERRRKRPKPLYKCFSFDDVWMERNQKRKLEKETQPEGGVQLQHLPQDPSQAGISPSITSPVAFDILPLKLHPFSQSTPTGLDCVGWKRRISAPGLCTID